MKSKMESTLFKNPTAIPKSLLPLSLFLIYITITVVKILFTLQTPSPFIFSDETAYVKMAQSLFENRTFSLWGELVGYPLPLYPAILSVAYAFGDGDITTAYPLMKIINAFLSSLIIIPVFLIAKAFLSGGKALFVAFLATLLPASFSFTTTIMSENLFYPLFMFSLFFMMKSITEDNHKKWDILCGVFIGLSILTRLPGLVLLLILAFALLAKGASLFLSERGDTTTTIKIWKMLRLFTDRGCIFLSAAVVAILWFLRNGHHFGFTAKGLTGGAIGMAGGLGGYVGSQPTTIPTIDFIYWALMHLGYFIFAAGIILFALAMLQTWKNITQKQSKNTQLTAFLLISWIAFLLLLAYCAYQKFHGGPYLMGRYFDPVLPSFIIMGAVGLDSFVATRDFKPLVGTLVVCSFGLAFTPINSLIHAFNTPDAYALLIPQQLYEIGLLSFEPPAVLIKLLLVAVPSIFFLVLAKNDRLKWKYIAPLLLVFFIVGTTMASGVMYVASNDAVDEMEVGLWLHEHTPEGAVVLFDERDAERMRWARWGTMFWADATIKIGEVSTIPTDYTVSLHRLDMPVVFEANTTTEVIRCCDNHYFVYDGNK